MPMIFIIAFLSALWIQPDPGNGADIRVILKNLRNDNGQIMISLYDDPKTFPKKKGMLIQKFHQPIQGDEVEIIFDDLSPGTYAIAAMHDENADKKMNYNLVGFPKEGFCFSNNAKPRFRAPSWLKASFELGQKDKKLVIDMLY